MTIMQILQKRRKVLVCVLSPHVDIAIEEEKSNMCFANDVQVLHTLYLSNGKLLFKMCIASLGFWHLLWVHF